MDNFANPRLKLFALTLSSEMVLPRIVLFKRLRIRSKCGSENFILKKTLEIKKTIEINFFIKFNVSEALLLLNNRLEMTS